ncbi:MAG: anacyclamide/piricyclamide family prenylated cyclic peptide [Symploca sp. SIO1B1]|nr:anacyclamide/piricyclamide family prenylated cyclic peptide [Symploca sp. SIO1B1]
MKTKKIIPQSVAPVKRENVATVSREGKNAIAPSHNSTKWGEDPFAGDDAE